jgi:hypothetical protein
MLKSLPCSASTAYTKGLPCFRPSCGPRTYLQRHAAVNLGVPSHHALSCTPSPPQRTHAAVSGRAAALVVSAAAASPTPTPATAHTADLVLELEGASQKIHVFGVEHTHPQPHIGEQLCALMHTCSKDTESGSHSRAYIRAHKEKNTHIHSYTHVRTHAHAHTNTHTRTHTRTHTQSHTFATCKTHANKFAHINAHTFA